MRRSIFLVPLLLVSLLFLAGCGWILGLLHHPPTATITSPPAGATFAQGASIAFRGSATDPEDGTLTGASLVWTSSIAGQIGTGTSFTRTLPVGTHTITLTATDSHGAMGTDSVTIIVQVQQDQVVTFPDPELERAIRDTIDKPTGPIFRSDLIGLTHLDAHGVAWPWGGYIISDLTGIEYLVNLTVLELRDNEIRDISPLAGLTNLIDLCLGGNHISDISPLAGLTNLIELSLANNHIRDISPLAGLTNLIELWLGGNHITDISPLAGLTNLTELWLWGNYISDISSLAGLINLIELDLRDNHIRDLTPLVANTGLGVGDEISLGGNPLDFTPGSQNMRDIEELRRRRVTVRV